MTAEILKEILQIIPKEKITGSFFEGANIVLYTNDQDFLSNSSSYIKEAVNKFKKRIELRADPNIISEQKQVEELIRKITPNDVTISQILFDSARSIVVIEADKPGLVIGKDGELLKQIRKETFWTPQVRRSPPISSKIVDDIRKVLYIESEYRKNLLNKVGERIYSGWTRGRKDEWIRLSFLGGARQVGRSCLFLQTPESRVLLDCGVDVANSNESYPYLDAPELKINELDAIIISHSHLDHIGLVPYLFKFGYRGPVYCTEPTRDVGAILLIDFIKVMMEKRKDPIFTIDDIKEFVKHTITLNYDEVNDITPDVRITLHNAGHVLGSSMVHTHVGNGLYNFLYTGDIKYAKSYMLEPALTKFQRLETVIMESTYGGKSRVQSSRKESEKQLIDVVKETIENKGKVLIPVLGSGRAQEVMLIIEDAIKKSIIPKVPIYIDGMVWDITAIYSTYPEYFNNSLKNQIFQKNTNPFLSDIFKQVGSDKERQEVINGGPCIILATSGMLVGGPSVEYLRNLGDNNRNSMIFVSYQGEGSLGRRIQNGEKTIYFATGENKHEELQLKIRMITIDGLSGHSDRKQLINFVNDLKPRPKRVILVHGESSLALDLASSIHKNFNMETNVPRNLDVLRLR